MVEVEVFIIVFRAWVTIKLNDVITAIKCGTGRTYPAYYMSYRQINNHPQTRNVICVEC